MSKSKEANANNDNKTAFGANDKQSKSNMKTDSVAKQESDRERDKDSKKSSSWGPIFKDREHFNQLHQF